jgi:hypothetical protein
VFVSLQTVDITRDKEQHTVPLAQVVAISSGFLAAATHHLSDFVQRWASTERLLNWGMLPNQINSECHGYLLANCLPALKLLSQLNNSRAVSRTIGCLTAAP